MITAIVGLALCQVPSTAAKAPVIDLLHVYQKDKIERFNFVVAITAEVPGQPTTTTTRTVGFIADRVLKVAENGDAEIEEGTQSVSEAAPGVQGKPEQVTTKIKVDRYGMLLSEPPRSIAGWTFFSLGIPGPDGAKESALQLNKPFPYTRIFSSQDGKSGSTLDGTITPFEVSESTVRLRCSATILNPDAPKMPTLIRGTLVWNRLTKCYDKADFLFETDRNVALDKFSITIERTK